MNASESAKLAAAFAAYAAYYRTRLDDQILRMYAEDLSDLEFAAVQSAMQAYRKNPKNRVMPLPAQIRELLEPQVDADSAAREVASRIVGAVARFGWPNPSEARGYVGEVGWEIVRRYGGWSFVCENLGTTLDIGTFQAQARDVAKSHVTHSPESMGKVIGLPDPAERRPNIGIVSASEIIARIASKSES